MSFTGSQTVSSRPSARPIFLALAVSVAVHATAFLVIPNVLRLVSAIYLAVMHKPLSELKKIETVRANTPVYQELPLTFVEVDPSQITPEAPKNAKYYSSKNSQAANPDAQIETDTPKIDGEQTHVPKTETVPRTKAFPLAPTPPKDPNPQEEAAEAKPKGGPKVGDLAMAKPAENPEPQIGETTPPVHKRPRTITEALSQKNAIPGEKMRQEGGVRQRHIAPSLDTKATPFGEYDAMFIKAVTEHWYGLIDSQFFSEQNAGKVVLEFRLNYDGRITDMSVLENSVDELHAYLCQRAILEPAPYERWPSDMRRALATDYRELRFTFYY